MPERGVRSKGLPGLSNQLNSCEAVNEKLESFILTIWACTNVFPWFARCRSLATHEIASKIQYFSWVTEVFTDGFPLYCAQGKELPQLVDDSFTATKGLGACEHFQETNLLETTA